MFSYWRSIQPEKCFDGVTAALRALAVKAAKEDLIIGLENEHACNIATASETARALAAVDHPNLRVVWDPANCFVSGEVPYPDGYSKLPIARIVHVHAKDCNVDGHKPIWGPVGEMGVDWRGQIAALARPRLSGLGESGDALARTGGDKHLASMICGRNLKNLVTV